WTHAGAGSDCRDQPGARSVRWQAGRWRGLWIPPHSSDWLRQEIVTSGQKCQVFNRIGPCGTGRVSTERTHPRRTLVRSCRAGYGPGTPVPDRARRRPPMPAWLDERDPWLTARLADTAAADAEPRMLRAVAGAMRSWLALARRAVLGEHTTRAAANGEPPPPPEEPPTLDSWPAPEEWTNLLSEAVLPVAALVFTEAWQQVARSATLPGAGPYQQRYLDQVSDRLSRNLWPDGVFEECRYELAEGLAHGESIDQIRDRLGLVLNIDAPSRRIRGRINELKREGLRVPGHLYDAARDADAQWHYYARRIARTEIMG